MLKKVASIFKTWSTLKCCNALAFNFTLIVHLNFFVAIDMYMQAFFIDHVFGFGFKEVIYKFLIKFFVRTCNLSITVRIITEYIVRF